MINSKIPSELNKTKILTGLKKGDINTISYLYETVFSSVKGFIMNNSGTETDAEDIFQDGLVIVYDKIYNDTIELTCQFNTYLFSICKHLWLQQLSRKKKYPVDDFHETEHQDIAEEVENNYIQYKRDKLFHTCFLKLSDICQKVLQLFFKKHSAYEIAEIMGYKSADYARKRKMKCKNKLKGIIMRDKNYPVIQNTI